MFISAGNNVTITKVDLLPYNSPVTLVVCPSQFENCSSFSHGLDVSFGAGELFREFGSFEHLIITLTHDSAVSCVVGISGITRTQKGTYLGETHILTHVASFISIQLCLIALLRIA